MSNFDGCQLPRLPKLSIGLADPVEQSLIRRVKRLLAVPWNYYAKPWIKQAYHFYSKRFASSRTGKIIKSAKKEFSMTIWTTPSNDFAGTQQQQLIDQLSPLEGADFLLQGKMNAGNWVRVRSREEIQSMLDPFNETNGCAFLEDMYKYCDTKQRVFKSMERFLDERDYKVKKVRGVILLENVICSGTPAFGRCDRSCFLFWREEWLEKIEV
jgi:hypothetical protein